MKTIIVLLHATILLWALACLEGCAEGPTGSYDNWEKSSWNKGWNPPGYVKN
jgi:hypothetical protein